MEISVENILKVIEKLPHSKGRVPYTYHHDYLRQHSKFHNGMSRSEVASNHVSSEIELHALCLICIMDDIGSNIINYISCEDIVICKKAKEISENVLLNYNQNK